MVAKCQSVDGALSRPTWTVGEVLFVTLGTWRARVGWLDWLPEPVPPLSAGTRLVLLLAMLTGRPDVLLPPLPPVAEVAPVAIAPLSLDPPPELPPESLPVMG